VRKASKKTNWLELTTGGDDMKGKALIVLAGILVMLAALGAKAYAEEMLGGEPKEFHVAIISVGKHSFILPSAIIVDDKAKRQPMELIVSNDTKEKHGFAIDKTIKITVTALDSLGGSEQSAYRIYDPVHYHTVGGQLYIRR
jgi:microcystin-dependent protein